MGVRKRVTCVTLVGHDFSDVGLLELSPVNEGFSLDGVLVVSVRLTGTKLGSKTQRMTRGPFYVTYHFVA